MKNLKALRESKHISQQKLGELIGVSQQAIHKYENDLAEPDIRTLISLSDYFETSIDYLVGNSENPRKYETLNPCELNPGEQHHINRYRQLPPSVRIIIDAYIQEYLEK
ncbi:MAG: helix-turn-helix transcriptional regulator [Lachnospiraceae bacterium]|nr:helix-turn-helix transcriptional regulator [Oscillospiraceae bacterium]MDY5540772.1 helix-turn-helix transcriptional regulator [Lachnospiraceae bacterium]